MLLWWGWLVLQAVVIVLLSSGMVHLAAVVQQDAAMVGCSSVAAIQGSTYVLVLAVVVCFGYAAGCSDVGFQMLMPATCGQA
jgi:hypothetical protein